MKSKIVFELLEYFIKESSIYYMDIPSSYEEARIMLRGLINIREPIPIPNEILDKESKLLQLELQEKQIVDASMFKDKIVLWQGDITTLKCDAIVNACNEYLLGCFIPGHSCIDNQIHTFAGINLRLACNKIMQGKTLPNGQVVLTRAYNLPSKYIIHTVGPQIHGEVTEQNEKELASCYIKSLELAKENNIRTIAFPCISTGVYGYPKESASLLACNVVRDYLKKNESAIDTIIFNVFSDEDYKIYERNLKL